ncbi:hypothetical protein E3N88_16323 [Mikania micrantha]|uniref:Uncharacterized protein n=1 Tax=Mikania micrantha TaxID=192012 RepID=A0A5N6P070_9ASTR|nr:hypothetical protein E3N88_16323 [Mikania micrantha]
MPYSNSINKKGFIFVDDNDSPLPRRPSDLMFSGDILHLREQEGFDIIEDDNTSLSDLGVPNAQEFILIFCEKIRYLQLRCSHLPFFYG